MTAAPPDRPTTLAAVTPDLLAAVRAAAPPATAWLARRTAVASGRRLPVAGYPLDGDAAGLSAADAAREGTPSFRLVIEGEG